MKPVSQLPFPKPEPFGSATTAGPREESVLGSLTDRHIAALTGRGFDPALLARMSVGASAKLGGDDPAIGIPYFAGGGRVGCKHRTIAGEKRFAQDKGSQQIFYNINCLNDSDISDADWLIITEGELDCLAALQAGYPFVISVPGGAPSARDTDRKYAFVDGAKRGLDRFKNIILATDNDGPGDNLRHDLAMRLGVHRCFWIPYPKGCKDLADALKEHGVLGVQASIKRMQSMPIEGYYEIDELPPLEHQPALDSGIVGLSDHYKLRLGDLCVITGAPGAGKSSFINELCGRMALEHGWKTVFASFEQQPQTDHLRALQSFHAEKLVRDMSEEEKDDAYAWVRRSFGFIVPQPSIDPTGEWMLRTCRDAVLKKEAQILVIDPWNEITHERGQGQTLTEYTGEAIKEWKRFAKAMRVHLIIAAHPAKPRRLADGKFPFLSLWDISDSAHFANKPDVGIVLHRPDMKINETIIRVVKTRYHDIGVVGQIKGAWNIDRTRYTIMDGA